MMLCVAGLKCGTGRLNRVLTRVLAFINNCKPWLCEPSEERPSVGRAQIGRRPKQRTGLRLLLACSAWRTKEM